MNKEGSRNRIPASERAFNSDSGDPIYEAARVLSGVINTKTSALTKEEAELGMSVILYCGNHPSNPFARSQ